MTEPANIYTPKRARSELLPGLFERSAHVEFDLWPTPDGGLMCVGWNTTTKKEARFFFTKEQIETEAFKPAFNPEVLKLIEQLDG